MLKKLLPWNRKMVHAPGMPVCSDETGMPETDFNYCEPNVLLSEIKRVFFAVVAADPFDDWFNPVSWNARLSEDSNDRNAIRPLNCIADKPLPIPIRKRISCERNVTTHKTHIVNVSIDEVSDANHAFMQSLKKGKRVRFWYETTGGLMFGSNDGIIATVFGDMVLDRGQGEIMRYELQVIWNTTDTETYIDSPIFEDGGAELPPVGATMILYPFLECTPNGVLVPSVVGYWDIGFLDGGDFVNINALKNSYPRPDNTFRKILEEDWFALMPVGSVNSTPALVPQTLKDLDYQVIYESSLNAMLLFSSVSEKTIEFEDIFGNKASFSPLIILESDVNNVIDCAIAECLVEQLYSTASTATVRLTRSHANTNYANITSKTMVWVTPSSYPVRPDPDNPLDPDVILIDLPPGNHTIAIRTTYHSTIWGGSYPPSVMSFVINVI